MPDLIDTILGRFHNFNAEGKDLITIMVEARKNEIERLKSVM